MQRTNSAPASPATTGSSSRARAGAVLALAIAFAGITAVCLPFAVSGTDVPTWVVLVGRWIPAAASFLALRRLPLDRPIAEVWGLRSGGWRRLVRSYVIAVAVTAAVTVLPALAAAAVSSAAVVGVEVLVAAVPLLLLGGFVFAVSTLGEEVFWRGHLHAVLRRHGFWPASFGVGVLWMTWHLPLQWVYWQQGTLPPGVLLATTLGLLAWAPLLAALVERRRSVWPAVFAHAVPVSSAQLLDLGGDGRVALATVTVLTVMAMVLAAAGLRPRRSTPPVRNPGSTPT